MVCTLGEVEYYSLSRLLTPITTKTLDILRNVKNAKFACERFLTLVLLKRSVVKREAPATVFD